MSKPLIASAMTLGLCFVAGLTMASPSHAAEELFLLPGVQKAPSEEGTLTKIITSTETIALNEHGQESVEQPVTGPVLTDYTVQKGESLSIIANKNNLKWTSIYQVNESMADPNLLHAGQVIKIPSQDVELTREVTATTEQADKPQQTAQQAVATTTAKKIATTPKSTVSSNPSGGRLNVSRALSYVGYGYKAGGNSPATGFDCSGFTQFIASQQGYSLPRTVTAQYSATKRVSRDSLQAGDLVFFNRGHVAIYIGGNQVVHAATPSLGVRVDSLSSMIQYNGYWAAGRL